MTRWIIEKSQGFTNVGLLRISESVRAFAYLILRSQASAKSHIVGNTVSGLTAQKAFLINFENVVNQRVNTGTDPQCIYWLLEASQLYDLKIYNIYFQNRK